MLKGNSKAQQVCIVDNSNGTFFDDSMLPADDDYRIINQLEVGPRYYWEPSTIFSLVAVRLRIRVHVDFRNPAKSTLAGVDGTMPISVPAYDLGILPRRQPQHLLCPAAKPGERTAGHARRSTDVPAGALRRWHGTQHFLVTHSVNNTTAVAQRWYEFRARGRLDQLVPVSIGADPG